MDTTSFSDDSGSEENFNYLPATGILPFAANASANESGSGSLQRKKVKIFSKLPTALATFEMTLIWLVV